MEQGRNGLVWAAGWMAAGVLCGAAQAQEGASFVYLPGVRLQAVSADGSVACGSTETEAVRWTRDGGIEVLPRLAGYTSRNPQAPAVSWDGRVIVGMTSNRADMFSGRVAWVWREGVGTTALADLVGSHDNGFTSCISGNGQVVGGQSYGPDGLECVLWQDGAIRIAPRTGTLGIKAMTFSGEELLMVEVTGGQVAITLRDAAFNLLDVVSTSATQFSPSGLSETGDKVYGIANGRAAVWTRGVGVELVLDSFSGYSNSSVRGMSADGRVLVGNAVVSASGNRGWILQQGGSVRLLDAVAAEQLTPPPTIHMGEPYAISANGRTVIGTTTVQGVSGSYVFEMNPPCTADVDNGSGTGARDQDVTVADLEAFIQWMSVGDLRADLDNGSGQGVPDVSITIDDLIYFLNGFEAGC